MALFAYRFEEKEGTLSVSLSCKWPCFSVRFFRSAGFFLSSLCMSVDKSRSHSVQVQSNLVSLSSRSLFSNSLCVCPDFLPRLKVQTIATQLWHTRKSGEVGRESQKYLEEERGRRRERNREQGLTHTTRQTMPKEKKKTSLLHLQCSNGISSTYNHACHASGQHGSGYIVQGPSIPRIRRFSLLDRQSLSL